MADDTADRTLDPTPLRRQQARAEGRVARSADFTSAGMLLGGLVALVLTGGALVDYIAGLLTSALGGQPWMHLIQSGTPTNLDSLSSQWNPLVAGLGRVLLPPLVLVSLLAIALNIAQTGFLFLPHKVSPDAGRLSPLAGVRRVFSAAAGVRLTLGLFKLAVILAVAFASVYARRGELTSIGAYDLPHVVAFVQELCLWTCLKVGSALLVLAVVDYGFELWRHERDLRMTPQELREEQRREQGDPQVAAKRKQQREAIVRGVQK